MTICIFTEPFTCVCYSGAAGIRNLSLLTSLRHFYLTFLVKLNSTFIQNVHCCELGPRWQKPDFVACQQQRGRSPQTSLRISCADQESFVRGGLTLTTLFVVFSLMRGGRIQIPLLAGHQRTASEMPFKWSFAGGLMMAQH